MKINEILNEQASGSLAPGVAHAIPDAFAFPNLPNQDPYLQYRFGLAIAAARSVEAGYTDYTPATEFGENLTIVARSEEEMETIKLAQKLNPLGNPATRISTHGSTEPTDTHKNSPMQARAPIALKSKK